MMKISEQKTGTTEKQAALLSIIIPCFNVADTLSHTLDSILMQQTDFTYEVLVVDDCSTDGTAEIVKMYADKHNQIYLIRHPKKSDNACSFYDGLLAAKGDFFCVLNGDDYYTHREKLQWQINFFKTDVSQDYVASVHNYINDLYEGTISISQRPQIVEFTYGDFITKNAGNFHTSTYMFRNIFKGNVPEYFKGEKSGGDRPRIAFFLKTSRKKVKILDFVGSAAAYKDDFTNIIPMRIDHCMNEIKKYANVLMAAYNNEDFMLKSLYYSQYVDSLCATLSYLNYIHHPECIQQDTNDNHLAIVVGTLKPEGCQIFCEIVELIKVYADKKIMVLVANMAEEEVPEHGRKLLEIYPHVSVKAVPSSYSEKLVWLSYAMANYAPVKAYYYASCNDPYTQALMQSGVCKNICLFSFNYGFICGISNPNLDCIIAKRPLDYSMLRQHLGTKVIYIPAWQAAHVMNTISPYLIHEKPFFIQQAEEAIDDELLEIRPYEKMFGKHVKLDFKPADKKEQAKAMVLKSFAHTMPDNFCFLLSQNNADNQPYMEAFADLGYVHQVNHWQNDSLLWLYNAEYIKKLFINITNRNANLMKYITGIDQMLHVRQSYNAVFLKIEGNDPKIYFTLSKNAKYNNSKTHKVIVEFLTNYSGKLQLFYKDETSTDFTDKNSLVLQYTGGHKKLVLELPPQAQLKFLRLDIDNYDVPADTENRVVLFKFEIFEERERSYVTANKLDILFP